MRRPVDEPRLREFMRALAREASDAAHIYLTGGSCAVLLGWRPNTLDVDVKLLPDSDRLLRAIPALKDRLQLNVELASPADFIPELPGWRERSPFIAREGSLSFHHYDFYAQALAKIERGHELDRSDVRHMFATGLVTPERLLDLFERIEPDLYRYPAISPAAFRAAVEAALQRRHPTPDT